MSLIIDGDVGEVAVGHQDRMHFLAAHHPGLKVNGDRGLADPDQGGMNRNQVVRLSVFSGACTAWVSAWMALSNRI
jgi:hypothetical protein